MFELQPSTLCFWCTTATPCDECPPALLQHCFVRHQSMFKDAYSPYQLLCSSHMILDMAFVRAVHAASAWLGPDAMPAGYIQTWPPLEGATGL